MSALTSLKYSGVPIWKKSPIQFPIRSPNFLITRSPIRSDIRSPIRYPISDQVKLAIEGTYLHGFWNDVGQNEGGFVMTPTRRMLCPAQGGRWLIRNVQKEGFQFSLYFTYFLDRFIIIHGLLC